MQIKNNLVRKIMSGVSGLALLVGLEGCGTTITTFQYNPIPSLTQGSTLDYKKLEDYLSEKLHDVCDQGVKVNPDTIECSDKETKCIDKRMVPTPTCWDVDHPSSCYKGECSSSYTTRVCGVKELPQCFKEESKIVTPWLLERNICRKVYADISESSRGNNWGDITIEQTSKSPIKVKVSDAAITRQVTDVFNMYCN